MKYREQREGESHVTGNVVQPTWDFKQPTAVQMRVTLVDIEPAIWRRLVVPRGFHLGQLHHVIQAAFGWLDYHLRFSATATISETTTLIATVRTAK